MTDPCALSAGDLAASIAAGTLDATAVVAAHIARIEAINARLGALVVPRFDEARREAAAADGTRRRGEALGPLHGVPITVKESFDVAGLPTTAGVQALTGRIADADGALVARLRAAGAIILGKSNVAQLLYFYESSNPVYGRTINPWNAARTPGGSSGGEAVLVATGGSALGLGSDFGGSLRVPAHFCGVHTLKPTSWRLGWSGAIESEIASGLEVLIAQPGPIARRVSDLDLALRVLGAPGQETFDPAVPPVPLGDPRRVQVEHLRVGVFADNDHFPVAPAVRRAVDEAAAALRVHGITVAEFRPPEVTEAVETFLGLAMADGGASLRRVLDGSPRDSILAEILQMLALPGLLRPLIAGLLDTLGQHRAARVLRAVGPMSADRFWRLTAWRSAYRVRFLAGMASAGLDALLCPPYALAAPRHGTTPRVFPAATYATLVNFLGLPAGVVAATRVRPGEESDRVASGDPTDRAAMAEEQGSAGLPVGVQVIGRPFREDVVLALQMVLEEHFRHTPDYPQTPIVQG